ncbi:hypothetical protein T484DRAFT_1844616 [Baffinella frigidus]|nr:hypothetical protein T484DRAFT_1844616 [Cryptophyta sp. CCMP2293]
MPILQFATEYREIPNIIVYGHCECGDIKTSPIPNIIVCGHYECGGVNAAMSKNDHHAPLENWIRSIRDVRRLVMTQAPASV